MHQCCGDKISYCASFSCSGVLKPLEGASIKAVKGHRRGKTLSGLSAVSLLVSLTDHLNPMMKLETSLFK